MEKVECVCGVLGEGGWGDSLICVTTIQVMQLVVGHETEYFLHDCI